MTLFTILLTLSQQKFIIQNKRSILLVLYSVAFILYLCLGGSLFLIIEGPQIEEVQKDVIEAKAIIAKKYPGIPEKALDDFLDELRKSGVRGLPSPKGTIIPWTFADAVFFSTTLLTTIGYGHVTPRSTLGKVVCMLYTGLGIPVTLLLLASYVEKFMKMSESYKAMLFHRFQDVCKPVYIRLAHITVVMALIALVCFILPAILFSQFEKEWDMFDGIYFCFISLTTVGLGDLVPTLDSDIPYAELYKYTATFYMIAGITIMMFMMAMTADFQENYNAYYETLPFTASSEKIPINAKHTESYGSLLNDSAKSEKEKNQINAGHKV